MSLILALGLGTACSTARTDSAPSPLIIAHRGASWVAPENTLPAYELAWEMGSDGAEADFYLLADNRIIAFHDRTLDRTSDGTGRVIDMTFDQMRALDAGTWKHERYAGTPPATLEELLDSMPEGKVFYIEIKTGPDTVAPIMEIVDASGRRDDVVVIAFGFDVCVESKRLAPDIPVLWLIGSERDADGVHQPVPLVNVERAKHAGFEGLNISFYGITRELAEACRKAGLSLSVWTVNDPAVAVQLYEDYGVAAITTDRPDVMMEAFGRREK